MLAMENLLNELISGAEEAEEGGLPPGFRFHPTDEELVTFYLASKVFNGNVFGIQIPEVDLNRCEPWDLPVVAKMGEREWYFFSLRDRKYPTGLRTNRATGAGYWKATGKDREVHSASSSALLGMKKTLVFYRGRAPRGEKTKWVMHEYRLEGEFSCRHACKEEWVICRIVHKTTEKRTPLLYESQNNYNVQDSLPQLLEAPTPTENPNYLNNKNSQDIINDIKNMMKYPPPLSQSPASSFFPISASFNTTMTKTTNSTNYHQSASMLIKSLLLSHQDFDVVPDTDHAIPVPKQCKTEQNSPDNFQTTLGANMRWMDRTSNYHQDQGMDQNQEHLFTFDNIMDCYYGGVGGHIAAGSVQEVSMSAALGGGLNRGVASWPLVP